MSGVLGLKLVHASNVAVIASWCDTYFNLWNGPITVESLQQCRAAVRAAAEYSPQGYRSLTLVGAATPMMLSDEVRREMSAIAEFSTNLASPALGLATVVEGTSFYAAAVRALLAGLTRVQRRGFPSTVFDNGEAALAWLGKLTPLPADPAAHARGTAAAFALLRRHLHT